MTHAHCRTHSQTSDEETGNDANLDPNAPPIVTLRTDPQVDTTDDSLIPVQHTVNTDTVLTHFNTMSDNFNHQFSLMSENFNQQLSTQYSVIQSLLEATKTNQAQVNTTQAQVTTSSQPITNIETQLTSIQNQAFTFKANSKVQDLEKEIQNLQLATAPDPQIISLQQDVKDLQLALPTISKSSNKPNVTDVSTITILTKPQN